MNQIPVRFKAYWASSGQVLVVGSKSNSNFEALIHESNIQKGWKINGTGRVYLDGTTIVKVLKD